MKNLKALNRFALLFLLLVSLPAWALPNFSIADFRRLNSEQQLEVLDAYREFIRHQTPGDYLPEEGPAKVSFWSDISLMSLAYATSSDNCFFAGWPSSTREVNVSGKKKKFCTFPKKATSNCGAKSMQCQPALFGPDLCISTATQKQRNLAFSQCEKKFKETGRKLEDVAKKISAGELAAEAEELFALVDTVCREGFQAKFGMCRNLEKKIAAIRDLKRARTADLKEQVTALVARTEEIQNVSKTLNAEVQCDTCEAALKAQEGPVREPAQVREGPYTPQMAWADIEAGKLEFVGRDLMPGFDQNRTCIFKNERAYVLYHHCMANRKEAPAMAIDVISLDGGIVSYYVELYDSRKISETPREDYTGTFRVSYQRTDTPGTLNAQGMKSYLQKAQDSMNGACFIGRSGGSQNMDDKSVCFSGHSQEGWESQGDQFWKDPGERWLPVQKDLRRLVETVRF